VEQRQDVPAYDAAPLELEAWIKAAQRGDLEALGQALSSVRDYLLLVANDGLDPALKAKANASDLVQETFLRAQRGVERFRGHTASEWRQWLRSILLHNLAKERRRFGGTAKRSVQREVAIPEAMWLDCAADSDTPSQGAARARGGPDRRAGTPAGPVSRSCHLASSGTALI
jgi:RNA polymerase sigma-70 factor (ECF subfamily)